MRRHLLIILVLVTAAGLSATAQSPKQATPKPASKPAEPSAMTNADVIKMVRSGLGEALIIGSIKQARTRAFVLGADGLIELKTAGVSENIIRIMLDPSAAAEAPAPAPAPAPAVSKPAAQPDAPAVEVPPVLEIGVYYRDGDRWLDLLPEVVNWKSGGVFKHVASVGIVKGDVNGLINGPSAKTVLRPPIEILVYTADGIAVTEYQLLKLRQQSDTREFRTVTGGVLHAEGGARRDLVPFESKKIAPRTHLLILPTLTVGEYGILSPGAASSSSASAQLGKIYSFRIQ